MTDDLHHLAAAYALDALDPGEREAFESHYPGCDLCAQEVAELTETAAVLGAATATLPPPALKTAVMAAVAATRQVPPMVDNPAVTHLNPKRRQPRLVMLAAAAIVAVAGVGGAAWGAITWSGGDEIDELIAAPDAMRTVLTGDTGDAGSDLEVWWSPSRQQAAVIGSGLDEPGSRQDYALWAALGQDGEVVPAGLFDPDAGEVRVLLDVDGLDGRNAEGWGVTVEPDGGSPQPTSDILYSGET